MKKYLIPMIALLLTSCEQNNHAQNPIASQVPTTNAECKNLHKVLDIDDLLYQMYSNIDSHCLFEMPTAELEKIWGIPIIEYSDELLKQTEKEYIIKERDKLYEKKQHLIHKADTIYILKENNFNNFKNSKIKIEFSFSFYKNNYAYKTLEANLTRNILPNYLPPPNNLVLKTYSTTANPKRLEYTYQWKGMNTLQIEAATRASLVIHFFNSSL